MNSIGVLREGSTFPEMCQSGLPSNSLKWKIFHGDFGARFHYDDEHAIKIMPHSGSTRKCTHVKIRKKIPLNIMKL